MAGVSLAGSRHVVDRVVLQPTRRRLRTAAERHEVDGPAGRLELWRFGSSGSPVARVVHFHGVGGRAEREGAEFASYVAPAGCELWALNYPGYGGSQGPATLAHIAPAARIAADYVARLGSQPVIASGNSIGTTAALHVAAEAGDRPLAGLLLRNPPPLRELVHGYHGWWNFGLLARRVAKRIPPELDSLANGPRVTAPAVFLSSSWDVVVHPRFQRQVFERYAGPKQRINCPYAGHSTPLTCLQRERVGELIQWMLGGVP